jgi:mono/diheme cytochrome c family protein
MTARPLSVVIAAALGLSVGVATAAATKEQLQVGQQEYLAKCAPCHGPSGKGDGPQAAALKQKPSDLTTYAKRNGGKLPEKQAWAIIDGRQLDDRVQQDRAMPVWGHMYKTQARADERADVEPYVRARIAAVLEYLKTLQVK